MTSCNVASCETEGDSKTAAASVDACVSLGRSFTLASWRAILLRCRFNVFSFDAFGLEEWVATSGVAFSSVGRSSCLSLEDCCMPEADLVEPEFVLTAGAFKAGVERCKTSAKALV